jgi:hypothetical protein
MDWDGEMIKSEAFRDVRGMLNVLGIHLTDEGPSMDLDGEAEMIMTKDGPEIREYICEQ